MMKQYMKIKERHADCILFYRLGDFYEMFNDDARIASKELDLVLTSRDRSPDETKERVPMCGVPYHSSEAYIARLVEKGYKVAICEQMEDPATAKGLVERDVVRVITPGTLMETSMLDEGRSNYICAVYEDASSIAICFADVSTGEICATAAKKSDTEHILNEIGRFSPAECVISSGAAENKQIMGFLRDKIECMIQPAPERFDFMQCAMHMCEQFGEDAIARYGLDDEPGAVCAVGAVLSYLKETQKTDISYINKLEFYSEGKYMELDIQTVRNLELAQTMRTLDKKGSLLWVLDKTKTPMGARLLRAWLSKPLLAPMAIKRRHASVAELVAETVKRSEITLGLRDINDIERLANRAVYGNANARDMLSLSDSIKAIPSVISQLDGMKSHMLRNIAEMDILSDMAEQIGAAIADNPPFSIREGGMIRRGFNAEVDRLRDLLEDSTGAMAKIEAKERERTGKKLKVGYNKVFGYYIEMPRSVSSDVPDDYIRKQTLVNSERFITQELKELETELLNAKERLEELEYRLFLDVRQMAAANVVRVQETAARIAELDVLCSFANVAVENNYCMPEIDGSYRLEIKDGRHPVVEQTQRDQLFVPNDVSLDEENCRAAIITGPNMAGKSTYMRQTALIVLMAQIGSFVPAKSAHIGVVDRVFTRIGASDDLAGGKSTFMVEMTEVADILKNATKNSLIILDEIGRGTSTYDGMAIARAVLEYCADKSKIGAKTLFATHYHELTALEDQMDGVKNFSISAKKRGGDLIFLRKIIPGGADESYGIEVAGLAGVPDAVIRRAKTVLASLESGGETPAPHRLKKRGEDSAQMSMLDMSSAEVIEELRSASIDTMTPIEAMNMLYSLKKKVEQ